MVVEEAVDFGAFGAVPGSAGAVFEAVFQEEQNIAFHDVGSCLNGGVEGRAWAMDDLSHYFVPPRSVVDG